MSPGTTLARGAVRPPFPEPVQRVRAQNDREDQRDGERILVAEIIEEGKAQKRDARGGENAGGGEEHRSFFWTEREHVGSSVERVPSVP